MLNHFRFRKFSSFAELEKKLRSRAENVVSSSTQTFGTTFDYYKPGARVKPRYHELSFSEKEREEVKLWQSNMNEPLRSSRYSVSPSSTSTGEATASEGPLTNLAAEVASLTAADVDGATSLTELRSRYKQTLPVYLVVAAIQKQAREPLHSLLNHVSLLNGASSNKNGLALAASVTAPPTADEEALLKDEVGRENLLSKAASALKDAQLAYYLHSISRKGDPEIAHRAALLFACFLFCFLCFFICLFLLFS
jgi:hypothetical protein